MSFRNILLALTVASGLAVGTDALAQHPHGGGQGMGEVLRAVQLTAAQKQQIHQIMSAAHTQTAPQMAQMKALQQQIDTTLFGSGTVTEAQLMPLEQQKETLRQQLDVVHLQTEVAIRNLLTSAQLTQAASIQTQLASLRQQEHAITAPTE